MNKKQESLSPSLKEKQKEFPTNVKKLIGIASRLMVFFIKTGIAKKYIWFSISPFVKIFMQTIPTIHANRLPKSMQQKRAMMPIIP